MAKSIAQLKKGRKSSLESLQADVKKQGKQDFSDARFWKPSENSEGQIFAEIRFLPAPPDSKDWGVEEQSFVKYLYHYFLSPKGKWYKEQSLRTFGRDESDPASEYSDLMWDRYNLDKKNTATKKAASDHGLKKKYVTNILVVNDRIKPDNNGKVFLYEFGPGLFKKIENAAAPPADSGRVGFDVFSPWDGANFHIEAHPKIVNGKSLPNFENSQFATPAPLFDGDETKITALWETAHPLNQFIDPSNKDWYKPYDELVKNFERAMGAKMEQLLDPAFVPTKVSNPMENLEKQQGTLENYLSDDDEEDDIPDFAKKDAQVDESQNNVAAKTIDKTKTVEAVASDVELQGLTDLDGLDGI